MRGTAANGNLSKKCPNAACACDVSYLEETCYHVVISGLHDSDMKDRALTRAMLGNMSDLSILVNYCTAEESGKCVVQTVGGIRKSAYRGVQTPPRLPPSAASVEKRTTVLAEGLTGINIARHGVSSAASASTSITCP